MAHRVKCPECNSCMSPSWPDGYTRLYYCSLCREWYGGRGKELYVVPNPNQDKIDAASNKIEDPVFEEKDDEIHTDIRNDNGTTYEAKESNG